MAVSGISNSSLNGTRVFNTQFRRNSDNSGRTCNRAVSRRHSRTLRKFQ
jgi:hypothetical protein